MNNIEYENLKVKLNLSFFEGEKTEKPTAKKRRDSRAEGQVAKSQEIGTAFLFIASFFALKMLAPRMFLGLQSIMSDSLNMVQYYEVLNVENPTDAYLSQYFAYYIFNALMIVLPLIFIIMMVGLISNFAQVGWHPTAKPLKPKFSKLNPIKGFKRIFSMQSLIELLKSIMKLTIITIIVYNVISDDLHMFAITPFMSLSASVAFFSNIAYKAGITVGFAYLAIAIIDFIYQKYKHNKDLKMSKQEVKDEYKQSEGDPQVKGKIRQKMREASTRRMMQDIPSADVIITNPTHFAVAIRYKHNQDVAPTVVAKGADHLAKRIKDAAKENGIEIVENKPLARALYASVEVGEQIPPDLYQSVAEILVFVLRLKNKV